MMLRQAKQNFLQYLRFEKRYSVHTLTAYETDLEQFIAYASDQFDISDSFQINHFHVRSWLAALKDQAQTARSLNRKMSALNSFYKYLLRQKMATHNPVSRLHAMRLPERLPAYLKEAETERFLEQPFKDNFKGFTDRLICELLYQAGLRRAELLNLKEQSIEWSLKHIRVLGKGNKERLLPVNNRLLEALKQYLREKKNIENADRNYLLIRENGQHLYPEYIYRVVKNYLTLFVTLKKKSPHVLRHTFATHLLSHGANIQAIKELLGHSSLAATQIYTHNNIDKLKEIHKLRHPRG